MNHSKSNLGEREGVEAHVDAIVEDRKVLELLHLLRGVLPLAKCLAVFVHLFSRGGSCVHLFSGRGSFVYLFSGGGVIRSPIFGGGFVHLFSGGGDLSRTAPLFVDSTAHRPTFIRTPILKCFFFA